jgi:polyphosphate kinase
VEGEPQSDAGPLGGSAPSDRYFNRELSWLEFNRRVLAQAEDADIPLLERVKFLAIFSTNLDEFFQVRVAGLRAQHRARVAKLSIDGLTPLEQLTRLRKTVELFVALQEEIFLKQLQPALAEQGIVFETWDSLGDQDRANLAKLYAELIFPVLTPLSVDPSHPFPHISNLSLNLALTVRDPSHGEERYCRLKVPPLLPRFLSLGRGRFLPVEQLISAHLSPLFPGMEIVSQQAFRVTLDADLAVDTHGHEDAEDLLAAIESGLRRRHRLNAAVRLEIEDSARPAVREFLAEGLALEPADVYSCRSSLDLGALWKVFHIDRPDLKHPAYTPTTQRRLREASAESGLFGALRTGDVLVHHPYESFQTSMVAFLEHAAGDPDVLAIKHTLYRTSESENPVVRQLIRAAQEGKEVVALVELRARFDEETNIEWARSLIDAGVHVVFGDTELKTHGKVALVVRREGGAIRRYCQIGTGNYNPQTARSYEDISLLTASPAIGSDVGRLFNHLTGFDQSENYQKLLVAPGTLRHSLLAQIRRESEAGDGSIAIKVNALGDPEVIDALYGASCSGVEVDLIVRGICCLRPGVPGLSERIRVRSILGRYLEHSRIWRFGSAARGYRTYIGSADLLARNLDERVEVMVPIEDPALQQRIDEILAIDLSADAIHWRLRATGEWQILRGPNSFSSQQRFQEKSGSTR